MKYTIENIRWETHDLDDEVVNFLFTINITEPEELVTEHIFPLRNLLKYIAEKQPGFYLYWNNTRKSTGAWGPAETTTLQAIGTEAISQLYDHLEEYLTSLGYVESEYERIKYILNKPPEEQETYNEQTKMLLEELSASIPDIKKANERYKQFCERAEKKIREIAMEVYPELADLEPKQMLKFEHLFVHEIIAMQEHIDELLEEEE